MCNCNDGTCACDVCTCEQEDEDEDTSCELAGQVEMLSAAEAVGVFGNFGVAFGVMEL